MDVLNSMLQTNPALGSSQGANGLPSNAGNQGNNSFKNVMNQVASQNSNFQNPANSGNANPGSAAVPASSSQGSNSFESVSSVTEINIQVTETIQNSEKNPNQVQQSLLALASGLQQLMALLTSAQTTTPEQAQNLLVSATQGAVSPQAAQAIVSAVQSFLQSLPPGQQSMLSNPAVQQSLLNQLVQNSLGGQLGNSGVGSAGSGTSTSTETLDLQMLSSNATIAEITNNGSSASAVSAQTFAEIISLAQAGSPQNTGLPNSSGESGFIQPVNTGFTTASNQAVNNGGPNPTASPLEITVQNPGVVTGNGGTSGASLSQNFNNLTELLTQAEAGQVVLSTSLKTQGGLSDNQIQSLFGQNTTLNQILNTLTQSVANPVNSNLASSLIPPVTSVPESSNSAIQQTNINTTVAQQAALFLGDVNIQTLQTSGNNATLDGFLALYTANSPAAFATLNNQNSQLSNTNAVQQPLAGLNSLLTSFTANSPAAVIPAASIAINTPNLQSSTQSPNPSSLLNPGGSAASNLLNVNLTKTSESVNPLLAGNNAPSPNVQTVTTNSRVSNGVEIVSLQTETLTVNLNNNSNVNPSISATGSQTTDAASVPPVVAGGVQPLNFTNSNNSSTPSTGAQPGSQGSTAVQNVQVVNQPIVGTTTLESLTATAMPANMAMAVGTENIGPVVAQTVSGQKNDNVQPITPIESNSTIVQPVGPVLAQGVTSGKEIEDTFGLKNDLSSKNESLAALVNNGNDVINLSAGSSDKTSFISNIPNSNASNSGNNGVNINGIIEQLSGQVANQLGQSHTVSRLSFQLVPENLGKVTIQISLVDQSVSAKILVNNADVKEGLQNHLVDLKTALNQAGLQIDQLQVQIQGGSSSLLAQYYQYQQEGSGYGSAINLSGLDETAENGQNTSILGAFSQRNSLVDLLI
jgi:flagellar hook-length control protein FliK